MEVFLVLLGFAFMIVGILGSFLPVLPGPPLSLIGIFIFSSTENNISTPWLVAFVLITIIVTTLDYIIPALGTKKFGGTKYGVWGSTIGLLVGMFFGPWGIILGPFFGALIGELIYGQSRQQALKAALGSFVGFLFGTGLKFITSAIMLFFYGVQMYHAILRWIENI
ncbi:MAG: DUF456 domain-containing protein [Flavobacteriales bacterium]|nr:DUF456 domain-containing protein [Flavobacteriales bacterium]